MVATNSLMEYHYRDLKQNLFSVETKIKIQNTCSDQKVLALFIV